MASPSSSTARVDPSSATVRKIKDGYQTLITFKADSNIEFWEKTVTPPGYDGGDAIETTTMHNDTYRTFGPRGLITLTETSFTAAWDPICYTSVLAIINSEDEISVWFPDGSSLAFFGYLRTFEPSEFTEGAQPEASCTIQPTNFDYATDLDEAAPLLTNFTGT
jgi:hypothetical protein